MTPTELVRYLQHALMDVFDRPVHAALAPMRTEQAAQDGQIEVTGAEDIGVGWIPCWRHTGGFDAPLDPVLVHRTDEALDPWIHKGPTVTFVHSRGTATADIVTATVVHDGVTDLKLQSRKLSKKEESVVV